MEEFRLVGYRLRRLRMGKEIAQEDAGAEVGFSRNHLCQVELGRHIPNALSLVRLARFYGTSLDALFAPPAPEELEAMERRRGGRHVPVLQTLRGGDAGDDEGPAAGEL